MSKKFDFDPHGDFELDSSNDEDYHNLDLILFIIKDKRKVTMPILVNELLHKDRAHNTGEVNVRQYIPILEGDEYILKEGDYYSITSTGLQFIGYLKTNRSEAVKRVDEKRAGRLNEKRIRRAFIIDVLRLVVPVVVSVGLFFLGYFFGRPNVNTEGIEHEKDTVTIIKYYPQPAKLDTIKSL